MGPEASAGPRNVPLTIVRPGVRALVLRVESAGRDSPGRLCLNSKRLSQGELNSKLKAELSYRSVWVVYVEVDANLSWQGALQAIDTARGLDAQVVLLRLRPDFKQH